METGFRRQRFRVSFCIPSFASLLNNNPEVPSKPHPKAQLSLPYGWQKDSVPEISHVRAFFFWANSSYLLTNPFIDIQLETTKFYFPYFPYSDQFPQNSPILSLLISSKSKNVSSWYSPRHRPPGDNWRPNMIPRIALAPIPGI